MPKRYRSLPDGRWPSRTATETSERGAVLPGRALPQAAGEPTREALIRRASDLGQPIQEGDRLLAVAYPRADVLGVITIVGVPAGEIERARVPLEHATTVLALELSRLQSVAETELRLGRDLVEELLGDTDERAALSRAQALSYDLRRRHWVGIVAEYPSRRRGDPDRLFRVVRRAALDTGLGALVVPRGDAVVVLCANGNVWADFYRSTHHGS